ncbi:MAG: thiamine pyrophosphate-binding protein [Alphaproteobacteria bacterium]|nr:MAG: thiamine pyrophosphate-binding protein [Alphaproteobacteria bacterium]
MDRSGGQLLVAALAAQGVTRVFCVPGESYLDVLDALHDSPVKVTVARHEGGAAMMAEAWGKLTGRPGVALVTRGPGASNAAAGLHVAQQDSTPMVLFIGQVARNMRGRDAFQEIDYARMYGGIAKWVAEIDSAARIPEMVARAWATAMAGRPGPVVLALPQDMLVERTIAPPPPRIEVGSPAPAPADIDRLAGALAGASRPMIIAGGSRWDDRAIARLAELAARWRIPVATTFRRQSLIDNAHPAYAGELTLGPNPALVRLVRAADLVILLGDRMSEVPSQGYSLFGIPDPGCRLVHVHPGPEEIGRVYAPWLGIATAPGPFLDALAAINPPADPPWAQLTEAAHAAYLDWSTPRGADLMSRVIAHLNAALPEDAILTNGAGNYAIWVQRFRRWRPGTHLGPTSGSMGYGLPAAIAAGLHHPGRAVVCLAGDGCLQMTIQELATAAQEGLPLRVIVADNRLYGTIRAHQARDYPGRVTATRLVNPDFAALARACGFAGFTLRAGDAVGPVLDAALASPGPALVHVLTDPAQITPDRRLDD